MPLDEKSPDGTDDIATYIAKRGRNLTNMPRHLQERVTSLPSNCRATLHDTNLFRKRRRVPDTQEIDSPDEKGSACARPRQPYWPVQGRSSCPIRWDEFPFRPSVFGCEVQLEYDFRMEDYGTEVVPYTRADYWNLLPWVGPPLLWGRGVTPGIHVAQDHPPHYHLCTLRRDFITYWSPTHTTDPSVDGQMGSCTEMVPMVCAYCWGQTWRRCDNIPRVGAYMGPEARLSPVLVVCDHCDQTSDYNIIRCITDNDFGAIVAFVTHGSATINDVIRCADACMNVRWRTPPPSIIGVGTPGYALFGGDNGLSNLKRLTATVMSSLGPALMTGAPLLAPISAIGHLILDYWQGPNLTQALRFLGQSPKLTEYSNARRMCAHSFPCIPGVRGVNKCFWLDAWSDEWLGEVSAAKPQNNDMLARHHAWFSDLLVDKKDWIPGSWAEWEVLRRHNCEAYDGYQSVETDEGDDDEYGHAIDVYDGTRPEPTDDDDEEEEYMGATFAECTSKGY